MSRSNAQVSPLLKKSNGNGLESEYRQVDRLSYSSVAQYDKDRVAFYKRYILKENDFKETDDTRMGNLVDVLMTDADRFDDYFVITEAKKPTAQLLRFTELIFEKRNDYDDFIQVMKYAYEALAAENGGKVRDKLEKFIDRFNAEARDYYEELLNAEGKSVVTLDEKFTAEESIKKIENCEAFKHKGDVYTKHVILFEYNGVPLKCEIDEFDVCHEEKVIYLYDYKVTGFVESFLWQCYLDRRYYIQASLYKFALQQWAIENFPGYKVENMAFKVVDMKNYYLPLLYKTTDTHFDQGFTGFYVGKKYYKGVNQLLKEIETSIELNEWRMSIENFNNKGVILLPEFTQKED